MHIFIDESGTFTRGPTQPSISVVGALIIPHARLAKAEKKYAALRHGLPKENGEVKGRLLSEREIASVVSILGRYEVLFEVTAVDMAINDEADVANHKTRQAQGITRNLTDKHHQNLRASLFRLRCRLEGMTHQLYVQSVVTFALIERIIQHATLFYSQRIPKELALFHWVIDGKGKGRVTDWESWWSLVVMPILQSASLKKPLTMLKGSDYSHFERFRTTLGDYLKPYILDRDGGDDATDLRKLMTESFRFSSDAEPGLEMVDILANATRRALMGRLRIEGWRDIRGLMIHRRGHYIQLASLLTAPPGRQEWSYAPVIRHFSQGGKNMIAPRFQRQAQDGSRLGAAYR